MEETHWLSSPGEPSTACGLLAERCLRSVFLERVTCAKCKQLAPVEKCADCGHERRFFYQSCDNPPIGPHCWHEDEDGFCGHKCAWDAAEAAPELKPPLKSHYDLFASRCEGQAAQQFATITLLHQEDDQMIEEIVECLNGYSFRDCLISWTAADLIPCVEESQRYRQIIIDSQQPHGTCYWGLGFMFTDSMKEDCVACAAKRQMKSIANGMDGERRLLVTNPTEKDSRPKRTKAMYHVKIPLKYLGEVGQYNVPTDQQQAEFDKRVASILEDIKRNHIPGWATSHIDLDAVTVESETEK